MFICVSSLRLLRSESPSFFRQQPPSTLVVRGELYEVAGESRRGVSARRV